VLEYADVQDAMRCSFEDGEKEGLQKGMQQGMQQGALTIAKNMKVLGVPVASIAQYTGLTVEQINGLEATTVVN
jgi:predicted transposase/invertase (TIGR01784 family)